MELEDYLELHQKTLDTLIEKDYYPDRLAAILTKNGTHFSRFLPI